MCCFYQQPFVSLLVNCHVRHTTKPSLSSLQDAAKRNCRMICILVLCCKGEKKTCCATSVESVAIGTGFTCKCQQDYDTVRPRERQ